MKYLLGVLVLVGLVGCEMAEDKNLALSSNGVYFTVHCIDGVEYIGGYRELSPKYNKQGSISLCGGSNE